MYNMQKQFYSPSHLKMPCHRAIKFWLLKRILPRRPITQPWSSKVEPLPELGPKSNRVLSLKLIMEEISNSIMAVTIKISIIIFNLQPWFQVSSTKMHVYFCTKNKIALWEITLLEITLGEGLLSGIMNLSIKTDCESTKSSYDSNKKLKSKETIWIFLTSILPTKYLRLFEKL